MNLLIPTQHLKIIFWSVFDDHHSSMVPHCSSHL